MAARYMAGGQAPWRGAAGCLDSLSRALRGSTEESTKGARVVERGMRVRLRDRRWEIEPVHGAGTQTYLQQCLSDDRSGSRRLTVLPGLSLLASGRSRTEGL